MDPLFIIAILVFSLVLLLGWGAYAFYQSRQQTSEWGARVKGESSKPSQGKASEKTSHSGEDYTEFQSDHNVVCIYKLSVTYIYSCILAFHVLEVQLGM